LQLLYVYRIIMFFELRKFIIGNSVEGIRQRIIFFVAQEP
jgi:hypothetical protein